MLLSILTVYLPCIVKAEGRSWISSRTSSCCFHLSACINQPLEVRKEAGRVHQEDNKRRAMRQAEKRQKARHSPVSFQLLAGGGTSDVDFILAFGDPFVPDAVSYIRDTAAAFHILSARMSTTCSLNGST